MIDRTVVVTSGEEQLASRNITADNIGKFGEEISRFFDDLRTDRLWSQNESLRLTLRRGPAECTDRAHQGG